MRKLLIAAMLAAALMFGCATIPVGQPVVRPEYIERLELKTNSQGDPNVTVTIIDWRNDGHTLWVWVDNSSMPKTCDYVVILGILDQANDNYEGLTVINKQNSREEDPCTFGYLAYGEYLRQLEQIDKMNKAFEKGI